MNQRLTHGTADAYAANARFVPDLAAGVVDLLAPQPGERILDLGCGDGYLTEKLVAAGAQVVGVEPAADMLARARERGIDARAGHGEALDFTAEFDAVFSNAALHWMPEADAVVAGVARALKPGGRFVGEFGGHGNVAGVRAALHAALRRRGIDAAAADTWFFPTARAYGALLEAHGFTVELCTLFGRPTPIPGPLESWLDTFASGFMTHVTQADRPLLLAEVQDLLAPIMRDDQGIWTVDYVRLRFAARLAG